MSRLRLWVVALAAVLAAAPGFAQGTTGSLAGVVTDQQGAAVPGATVSAHNAATGLQRATTTDTSGSFAIHGLPVGGYELKVDLAGFAPLTRQSVAVNVGATTALDLQLEAGRTVGGGHGRRGRAAHQRQGVGGGRDRDQHPDREPAAQRPPIREPGRAGARRRASAITPIRPSPRSSRRRSPGAPAATSTTSSTAATTTTTRWVAWCRTSRSTPWGSSTS